MRKIIFLISSLLFCLIGCSNDILASSSEFINNLSIHYINASSEENDKVIDGNNESYAKVFFYQSDPQINLSTVTFDLNNENDKNIYKVYFNIKDNSNIAKITIGAKYFGENVIYPYPYSFDPLYISENANYNGVIETKKPIKSISLNLSSKDTRKKGQLEVYEISLIE